MRIFIGLVEVCDMVFTYAKGFRSLGHETFTVVKEKEVFNTGSEYDAVLFEQLCRYLYD